MLLECVNELDEEQITSEELFCELFSIEDAFVHEQKRQEAEKRATEVKKKSEFSRLYRSYKAEMKKSELTVADKPSYITEFNGEPSLRCGKWIANDGGVWMLGEKGKMLACYHPIYPKRILINAETNTCKVELRAKIRGKWKSVFVDRRTVASKSSIITLADYGIQVTSENAALLVQYLAEVEAMNEDDVKEQLSTSRLGWINGSFLPYEDDVVFDNEQNLGTLFNSIAQVGSRQRWYECIRQVRKQGKIEILVYIAASLASVLVEPVGALPFIVDLWGETGKGKTVALMIATSIWADPNEGAYMTDAKATTTAMEVRLNVLNSLPMTLDDMAQIKNQYDEDFSALVYRWCAGKGRDRSNVNLGLNKMTSWHNCILTNAEHSLVTETMQGGAINRIIDIEIGDGYMFDNGNEIADLVRNNYGYCGKEFVEQVQLLGFDEIREMQRGYVLKIKEYAAEQDVEKEEKQILPMSIILTADEIAEKHLFQDGVRLDFKQCCDLLKNRGEVSEHERAYTYIKDTIAGNHFRFADDLDKNVEQWGTFLEGDQYAAIIGKQFDRIMKEAGFNTRAFLSWAKKNNLIQTDGQGKNTVLKRICGMRTRCVVIDVTHGDDEEFVSIDEKSPFDD